MKIFIYTLIIFLIHSCANQKYNGELEKGIRREVSVIDNVGKSTSKLDTISYRYEDYNNKLYISENELRRIESERYLYEKNKLQGNINKEYINIIKVNNNIRKSNTINGNVVYKIPTEMSVRNTYQVIVRISKSTINIYENLNGDVMTSTIPITETMEVKVIDPSPKDNKMFEIISDNKSIQLVENNENITQWTFNVTPIRVGKSKLKIVISIIRDNLTKEIVYEDTVKVKSDITKTIPYFISKYWQFLLTTIIIPFIVWIVKLKKRNREINI